MGPIGDAMRFVMEKPSTSPVNVAVVSADSGNDAATVAEADAEPVDAAPASDGAVPPDGKNPYGAGYPTEHRAMEIASSETGLQTDPKAILEAAAATVKARPPSY